MTRQYGDKVICKSCGNEYLWTEDNFYTSKNVKNKFHLVYECKTCTKRRLKLTPEDKIRIRYFEVVWRGALPKNKNDAPYIPDPHTGHMAFAKALVYSADDVEIDPEKIKEWSTDYGRL
jgi:hypothetical protein